VISFTYKDDKSDRRDAKKRNKNTEWFCSLKRELTVQPVLTAKYLLLESFDLSLLLNNRDVLTIRTVDGDACERASHEKNFYN